MRKIILLLLVGLFLSTVAFADWAITRGPDIGEIYFIGPTATGEGIYYSTDFGETAVCMDSISEVESICADLTQGVMYRIRMPNVLYYSSNYGQYGSWIFRNNDIYEVYSGRNEGYVYNRIGSHSEDYGINFETHQCNGYFGLGITGEIDNQDSVGYAIVYIWGVPDSLYLLVSYDNFENFEVQNVFYGPEEPIGTLTRGFYSGELYTIGGDWATLRYSNNYGFSWEVKNTLYFNNVTDAGIVGGRQPGEIYVFKNYIQLMWQIAHTYIYHSLDYGETFEVYHPISFGPPPYYANFEADSLTGTVPLSVQFTDLSSGENIQNWEWDFQNDGIIDSYEQNPEYTYQDTGSYSVRLLIDFGGFDILIRQNYIHVTSGQSCNEHNIQNPSAIKLTNYPNPFKQETVISCKLPPNLKNTILEIYNVKGQLIKQFKRQKVKGKNIEIVWDGRDESRKYLSSGIYFYRLNINNSPIKKMILLR